MPLIDRVVAGLDKSATTSCVLTSLVVIYWMEGVDVFLFLFLQDWSQIQFQYSQKEKLNLVMVLSPRQFLERTY